MRPIDCQSFLGQVFAHTLGRMESHSPWIHLLVSLANISVALLCALFAARSTPAVDWTMAAAIGCLALLRYLTADDLGLYMHLYNLVLLLVACLLAMRCYWLFE